MQRKVIKGRFREDLLQRLKRYQIHIPPLRERKEDIPVIVDAVVKSSEKPGIRVHPRVMGILESFSWPTNVRQLEQTLLRAIMVSNGETLTVGDLPRYLFKSKAPKAERKSDLSHGEVETDLNFEDAVERFSSVYLRTVISQLPRPITLETLGEAVGMSKSALHRRLEKYEIDLTPAKSPADGAAKETVQ